MIWEIKVMKKYLLGFIGLALAVIPVFAQPPRLGSPAPGGVTLCPPEAAKTGCTDCAHTKSICVPEPYIRQKTKVVYSSGSEPLCMPYLHGFFGLCGCDASGRCGPPFTRRYLIKKIQSCPENATRCVPVEVPACGGRDGSGQDALRGLLLRNR
jgi:hypothetical protein